MMMLKNAKRTVIPRTPEEDALLKIAMEQAKHTDHFAKQREEARKYLQRMKDATKK